MMVPTTNTLTSILIQFQCVGNCMEYTKELYGEDNCIGKRDTVHFLNSENQYFNQNLFSKFKKY